MRRSFVLTPEARADLLEILGHIAGSDRAVAERLRQELRDGFRRLSRSPAIGHYHDELMNRNYRFWNFYSYVVCYRWNVRPIQIIAIVHGRRDLAAFFRTR